MSPQETIRRKRTGHALDATDLKGFAQGLVDGSWSDAQVAALAMVIATQGMSATETATLTTAMATSGTTLDWRALDLHGPTLDKHSTGGVGDKVSLLLAPIVAACGGYVPMVSGRRLGHTGGTLDKLEVIPGYRCYPDLPTLRSVVQTVGCAIVGATQNLAPADARLYAIRDATATVDCLPLITSSILSKKLAAGLQGLVLDIKVGSGAFCPDAAAGGELAQSLLSTASAAGLPATAWITDMDQVLGHSCGLALEVKEAIAFLRGDRQDPRLRELTLTLCADLLHLGHLAPNHARAMQLAEHALASGAALEKFAAMVCALGGPRDLVDAPQIYLPQAPVRKVLPSPRDGWLCSMNTRAWGELVNTLTSADASCHIPPEHAWQGLSDICPVGTRLEAGSPLLTIHATTQDEAEYVAHTLLALLEIGNAPTTGMQTTKLYDL